MIARLFLQISFRRIAQFAYDGSQLLTIFEIKLNGADFSSSVNMFHLLRVQEIIRIPKTANNLGVDRASLQNSGECCLRFFLLVDTIFVM